MAEQIREILVQEQDHQIDLALPSVKKFQTSSPPNKVLSASVANGAR